MNKFTHELIVCIVNAGCSELVMNAAKNAGASGGTILNAKGTANKEAEAFFKITIQPEKEMVMIIVSSDLKEAVLHALYKDAGLGTAGQGIAFSMPVDHVVGLSKFEKKEEIKTEAKEESKTPQETDNK